MSEALGYPEGPARATGAIVPGPHRRQLLLELAHDVLGTDEAPSELLSTALQQLIARISGDKSPERPVDWAAIVQENVQGRPNFF